MKLPPISPGHDTPKIVHSKDSSLSSPLLSKLMPIVSSQTMPQLINLLRLTPLLPLLSSQLQSAPKEIQQLLSQLFLQLPQQGTPFSPQQQAQVLSQLITQLKSPDSALHLWLRNNNQDPESLLTVVRLVAEQHVSLLRQPLDEPFLLFVWEQKQPLKVRVKKRTTKQQGRQQRQVWEIWVHLPVADTWIEAQVLWQDGQTAIHTYTDSEKLQSQLELAGKLMTKRLSQQGITMTEWQCHSSEHSHFDVHAQTGLSIKV
nr:hypothetical protein [Thaumasiovibrio subtropicus]